MEFTDKIMWHGSRKVNISKLHSRNLILGISPRIHLFVFDVN